MHNQLSHQNRIPLSILSYINHWVHDQNCGLGHPLPDPPGTREAANEYLNFIASTLGGRRELKWMLDLLTNIAHHIHLLHLINHYFFSLHLMASFLNLHSHPSNSKPHPLQPPLKKTKHLQHGFYLLCAFAVVFKNIQFCYKRQNKQDGCNSQEV